MLSTREASTVAALAADPAAFGELVLGRRYTPDQLRVLASVRDHRNTAVPSGHNVGKTLVVADLCLWWLWSRRPSKFITTAPSFRAVNDLLWNEIRSSIARVDLGLPPPMMTPSINVAPDHFGRGISTDRPHNIQGYHSEHLLAVFDEASGIPLPTWIGVQSFNPERTVAIGNPEAIDEHLGKRSYVWTFFEKCRSSDWNLVHLSCLDHPNVRDGVVHPEWSAMVTRGWVEECEREWGRDSPLYQARCLGEFPEQGSSTLIPLSWIERAVGRTVGREGGPVIIGCDVARWGPAETAFAVLDGRRLERLWAYVGRDTMRTVAELVRERRRWPGREVVIVIDDVGLGGGVTDRLRELSRQGVENLPVLPFDGGVAPSYQRTLGGFKSAFPRATRIDRRKERFDSLRCEAWWELRLAFQNDEISIVDDPRLKSQLTTVNYEPRSDGLIEVESKKSMRARTLPSPDRADAVVMAWWGRQRSLGRLAPEGKKRRRVAEPSWRDTFDEITGTPEGTWG